ncbi:MAG: apolipoprotein N-acyltransferase [Phycisphaerales bacterium]|nr:apolipoprotein N-acyltransferase [Planctomycetota bacterium]MCH8507616.1 apolipoprotein N-acyltransferase [Phycisphaerales bacterium]
MSEPTQRPETGPARPRLRAFVLGLAHALLFAMAFPPLGWWWMAFLAPVPLLMVAYRPGPSPMAAGFWAMLGVLPFWVWTHGWIAGVSMLGVYPLVVYLGLYAWAFVVLGAMAARARRIPAMVGLIVVWLGLEFFRGRIAWSGYPWYLTGHPLIESPSHAWLAALGGVTLVSLMVLLPGAWWVTRRSCPRRWAVGAGVVFGAWLVGGPVVDAVTAERPGVPVRIGIVQTNVPQDNRMDWTVVQRLIDWMAMRDLTVGLAMSDDPPELIVWPEGLVPGWTMDPVSLRQEIDRGIFWRLQPETAEQAALIAHYGDEVAATQIVEELLAMQHALGVPMLVGSVAYEGLDIVRSERGGMVYDSDAMFNSAFLIRNGRVSDVWYDKVHLTPFGETMPYISNWPWLQDRLLAIGADGMSFGLTPARSIRTLPLHGTSAGDVELVTPICFEATMPAVCRRLVGRALATGRPVLMVNITNDGWFAGSDRGRLMHELGARWRCVELGLSMVRCANTGVSGLIDRRGRVVSRTEPRVEGTLVVEAPVWRPRTPYLRVGEWGGWAALALLPVLAWMGRARNSSEPSGPDE